MASALISSRAFLLPLVACASGSDSRDCVVPSANDRTLTLITPVPRSFHAPSKKYKRARDEKCTSSPSSPVSTVFVR